jgi:predicted TIM-barrel fold metal-dependent hydrolase
MTESRVVDHQAHWYPEALLKEAAAAGRCDRYSTPSFYKFDLQLASMDRHGIDVAVLSTNLIGDVDALGAREARDFIERCNEAVAALQREHPDRIAGLAMLPMAHPEEALLTLDRAIGELDLRGVCVLSNIGGKPIYNEELLPVYKRLSELGVPLYLHPHNQSMALQHGVDAVTEIGAMWMADTTAAALTLVYRGVLDACPGFTVVHPHAGGVLPYICQRVEVCEPAAERAPEHPLTWYMRNRFYVDSATDTRGALTLAIRYYGADRIVFATDWPWLEHQHYLDVLNSHGDQSEIDAIIHQNATPGLRLAA